MVSFRGVSSSWIVIGMLALVLIVGGGNLAATWSYVHDYKLSQVRQSQIIVAKLCTTLDELAQNKPPTGNPDTNPSRAYEQKEYRILTGIGHDIGCKS